MSITRRCVGLKSLNLIRPSQSPLDAIAIPPDYRARLATTRNYDFWQKFTSDKV